MGPFPGVGVKYNYDYIVDVNCVPKTYHINLKKYFLREEVNLSVAGCFDLCTESRKVCGDSAEDVENQLLVLKVDASDRGVGAGLMQ